MNRFRSFRENRALNQNALLLLDFCQSGAGDRRVVADDAVQNRTRETAAVVFASSSGSERSFEDDSYGGGHGAFTAALLAFGQQRPPIPRLALSMDFRLSVAPS